MIAVRISVVLILSVALFCQDKPKDVDGWDQIKWGMTIADARSRYGIEAKPENTADWMLLTLKPVRIAGVEMSVQAVAPRATEKISSVRLWSYFGLTTSTPGAGPKDFDTLRKQLTDDYGPPAKEETTRGLNFRLLKTVAWSFPSTRIELNLEQSGSLPSLGNITLEYTAAPK